MNSTYPTAAALGVAAISVLVGLLWLRRLKSEINIFTIWIVMCGAFYGVGTMTSFCLASDAELEATMIPAGVDFFRIGNALVVVAGFLLVCWSCATLLKRYLALPTACVIHWLSVMQCNRRAIYVSLVAVAMEALLLASGAVSYGGSVVEEGSGAISPFAMLSVPVAEAVLLCLGFCVGSAYKRFISFSLALPHLAFLVLFGRRIFITGLLIHVLGIILGGARRGFLIIMLVVGGILTALAFVGFYSLRLASYELASENVSLGSLVKGARDVAAPAAPAAGENLKEQLGENIRTRPLYVPIYLAALVSAEPSSMFGSGGKLFRNLLMTSAPAALFPEKRQIYAAYTKEELLAGQEETLAWQHFHLARLLDESNTMLTTAFTDGRWVGLPLYLLLSLMIIAFVLMIVKAAPNIFFKLVLISSVIHIMVNVEIAYAEWLVVMRNSLVWLLAAWVYFCSRRLLRNRSAAGGTT